jgi:hypothetical protein
MHASWGRRLSSNPDRRLTDLTTFAPDEIYDFRSLLDLWFNLDLDHSQDVDPIVLLEDLQDWNALWFGESLTRLVACFCSFHAMCSSETSGISLNYTNHRCDGISTKDIVFFSLFDSVIQVMRLLKKTLKITRTRDLRVSRMWRSALWSSGLRSHVLLWIKTFRRNLMYSPLEQK